MKKIIAISFFRYLFDRLRSRFAPGSNVLKKSFSKARHKKVSPRRGHLLRMARLLRNRFRQTA